MGAAETLKATLRARARCQRVQTARRQSKSVRYEAADRAATRPAAGLLAAGALLRSLR